MSDQKQLDLSSPPPGWRRLYPFASHWLEVDGERLHYVDEAPQADGAVGGALPAQETTTRSTLLFVHGNPTWSFYWRSLVLGCRSRYRCIAVDHLGCGFSSKPSRSYRLADRRDHLLELIDRLDLERVTLVGHDWGGAIGLAAALERPARFNRLILLNTGAFRPWRIPWRIRVCRLPLVGRGAVQGANLFLRAALRMTLARQSRLAADVVAGCLAPYQDWDSRRAIYEFVADIPAGAGHPTWRTLSELESRLGELADLPTLLVWGMRDWCFQPDCLEKFQQVWPAAEIEPLSDVGHWVMEDATEDATAAVVAFLSRTEPSGAAASSSSGWEQGGDDNLSSRSLSPESRSP